MEHWIFRDIIILLASTLVIFLICNRLRLPVIIGFLITGVLIGPGSLGLIKSQRLVENLAEIGIVMLLFSIGLEFSASRIRRIGRYFWLGGFSQVMGTILLAVGIGTIFKIPFTQGVLIGFVISMSSTAVLLREYQDRNLLDTIQLRISLGISLFQDLAVVPMALLMPLLAGTSTLSLPKIFLKMTLAVLVMFLGSIIAKRFLPKLLQMVVRTRVQEVNILVSLAICLGMTFLSASLGLSPALGAFIAGLIIAESDYSHQVVADIIPFKDLFLSIFFISVGMSLNVNFALRHLGTILWISLVALLIKATLIAAVVKVMRHSMKTALISGVGIASIGEFSFVLTNLGRTWRILSEEQIQILTAAAILTITAIPFLIAWVYRNYEQISRWTDRRGATSSGRHNLPKQEMVGHVIVAGYGLNGQNLARVLQKTAIPFIILELNPDTVRRVSKEGVPIIFGDISSKPIQKAARLESAKVIVLAISDPAATRRGVKIARELNPHIHIIVRTRFVAEIEELYRLGADHVVPEEFETSLELFSSTLEEFHIPSNVIQMQREIIRKERYGVWRGEKGGVKSLDKVFSIMAAGTAETYLVEDESPAAGKNLRDLNLRQQTGATIVAVVRNEKAVASPPPEFTLQNGDILMLVANHRDMDRAFAYLRTLHD